MMWDEDAQAWFYFNEATGEAVWEPPVQGYTNADGLLVLITGEEVQDPLTCGQLVDDDSVRRFSSVLSPAACLPARCRLCGRPLPLVWLPAAHLCGHPLTPPAARCWLALSLGASSVRRSWPPGCASSARTSACPAHPPAYPPARPPTHPPTLCCQRPVLPAA